MPSQEGHQGDDRGRYAAKPQQIPPRGWKDILKRTRDELRNDHVTMIAAGVAFFVLFAIIPAMGAVISIYGLVADPGQIQQQFESLKGIIPGEAHALLSQQLQNIADSKTAGWAAVLGLLLAIWSGSKGVKALIEGLNIAYHEDEKRNFIKLSIRAVLITLAGVVGAILAVGLIAVMPALLKYIGLDQVTKVIVMVVRWPLLIVLFMLGLSFLYRYGPSRKEPKWKWVSWGAALATLLWVIISGLFSLYVSHFNSYNKTYGSMGAVVILLMWFYLSAYVVLMGAEINTEMERQTKRDTTTGPEKPMGHRGAFAADVKGEARS